MTLTATDLDALRAAQALLENPGLAARISHALGSPLERGLAMLPERWQGAVTTATRRAIDTALDVALRTLSDDAGSAPARTWHKLAVGATGAAGGAFGLAALAVELPVSTALMLRSIAEIARSEGEDLARAEARLQCVQVLALGGRSHGDDAAEAGYFAARAAMAKAVSDAARHLAQHGLAAKGAPAVMQFVTQLASRFSIHVSQKVAAQAVPVVGAVGGALINTVFIEHFQDTAQGHFVVRRLERAYGADAVAQAYAALLARR